MTISINVTIHSINPEKEEHARHVVAEYLQSKHALNSPHIHFDL